MRRHRFVDKSDWETVNLPHDWAVYNEFEENAGPSQGYKNAVKRGIQKDFVLMKVTEISKF